MPSLGPKAAALRVRMSSVRYGPDARATLTCSTMPRQGTQHPSDAGGSLLSGRPGARQIRKGLGGHLDSRERYRLSANRGPRSVMQEIVLIDRPYKVTG